jgi:ribosomal protein S18 acetylase RimI-like enzyme
MAGLPLMTLVLRPTRAGDRGWIADAIRSEWGSLRVVSRGRMTEDASALAGLVAERGERAVGYAMLRLDGDAGEVVVLHSLEPRSGVGRALLDGARAEAGRAGCSRLWLITTNDNVEAIAFYQRCGWDWVEFHRDALTASRRLKPEIPEVGAHGIPLRHELVFEAPSGAAPRGTAGTGSP